MNTQIQLASSFPSGAFPSLWELLLEARPGIQRARGGGTHIQRRHVPVPSFHRVVLSISSLSLYSLSSPGKQSPWEEEPCQCGLTLSTQVSAQGPLWRNECSVKEVKAFLGSNWSRYGRPEGIQVICVSTLCTFCNHAWIFGSIVPFTALQRNIFLRS